MFGEKTRLNETYGKAVTGKTDFLTVGEKRIGEKRAGKMRLNETDGEAVTGETDFFTVGEACMAYIILTLLSKHRND